MQFTTGNVPMKSTVITNRSQAGPKFFASVFSSNGLLWLGTGLSVTFLTLLLKELRTKFGFTPEHIVEAAKQQIAKHET